MPTNGKGVNTTGGKEGTVGTTTKAGATTTMTVGARGGGGVGNYHLG